MSCPKLIPGQRLIRAAVLVFVGEVLNIVSRNILIFRAATATAGHTEIICLDASLFPSDFFATKRAEIYQAIRDEFHGSLLIYNRMIGGTALVEFHSVPPTGDAS